jgi:hypothetical protein
VTEDNHQTSDTPGPDKSLGEPGPALPFDTFAGGDVAITIKGLGGEEFKIISPTAQLEQIGELLRGKRRGWGIRTFVISIFASTATLFLSGAIAAGFQYVSWANTVIVSNANDRVAKARDVFSEAMRTVGDRYTATRDFIPALQELVNIQTTADSNLAKTASDLNRKQMTDYYDKLKQWNVEYNGLLVKIDYDLDRQIYLLTGTNPGNPVTYTKTAKVDCTQFITEQMRKVGYEQHSLKAQFAIINYCFGLISTAIDNVKSKALSDKTFKIDDGAKTAFYKSLDDVNSTTNTFQCYAKQRQEFYIGQIATSVVSPITLLRLSFYEHAYGHDYVLDYVFNGRRPAALAHFKSADTRCDPS